MNTPSEDTLFAEALARPAAERAAFLDQACAGDPARRARFESLLRAEERARQFLKNSPAADATCTGLAQPLSDEKLGEVIGRYKLLQKLGEGGCGTVYLAEQSEPVHRRVAVKVIKLGMDTKEVIARFEAERQALAMMDHPNIAKVLDAGATAAGRPFFAMELVRGIPLTKYCDENNMPTAGRLQLFTAVCHAIQHAHQKGIIHRDIKPSNILVTLHDGVPVLKVIDFGIAKATQGRLTDATLFTAIEQFVGTPTYMSPEQAELSGLDIDTRSDIYSLGVLLYELLTGRTPFDTAELLKLGLDTMRRHIREIEPPRPSTRLSTMQGEALSTTAKHRQIGAPKLISLLRGDLDWIVMKALEKNRARRYETANALADDLARQLAQEPVRARPPSVAYRFGKALRRHKLGFVAGTIVSLAIVAGLIVSISQAVRARRAERTAEDKAAISRAVSAFLTEDLLRAVDLGTATGGQPALQPNVKLRELLDRAGEKVGSRFENQPATEADMREIIGWNYSSVGDATKSALHLERALQLRKAALGPEHADTLAVMGSLANAYFELGRQTDAMALSTRRLEVTKRVRGPEHPDSLVAMDNVAWGFRRQGKYAEAAALYAEVLAMRKRVRGSQHPDTLASMNFLAIAYGGLGKHAEATKLYAETLEIRRRLLGPENFSTLVSMGNLAVAYAREGKHAEAAALQGEALEIRKRRSGPEHPDTIGAMSDLAYTLKQHGKLAEAATLYAQVLDTRKRLRGPEFRATLESMDDLADTFRRMGKHAEGVGLRAQALEIRKRVRGPEHPDTLSAMNNLADAYWFEGKFDEAAKLHAETLEARKRVLGPEHLSTLRSGDDLALDFRAQGKYQDAAALRMQSFEMRKRIQGVEHADTLDSMEGLAMDYRALSRPAEAEALLAPLVEIQKRVRGPEHSATISATRVLASIWEDMGKLPEAEVGLRALLLLAEKKPNNAVSVAQYQTMLGRVLVKLQKYAEAEPMLRTARAVRDEKLPNNYATFVTRYALGGALAGQGKYAEAEPLLISAHEGLQQRITPNAPEIKGRVKETLEQIVKLYTTWNKPGQAAEWQKKLDAFNAAEAKKQPSK